MALLAVPTWAQTPEEAGFAPQRSAGAGQDIPAIATGNAAIDLLLKDGAVVKGTGSATAGASLSASSAILSASSAQKAQQAALRDALIREGANFAEAHRRAAERSPPDGPEVPRIRADLVPAQAAPPREVNGRPSGDMGASWIRVVKEWAEALRENREWIIGLAGLAGLGLVFFSGSRHLAHRNRRASERVPPSRPGPALLRPRRPRR